MIRIFWGLVASTAIYFVALAAWSTWAISGQAGGLPLFDARVLGYGFDAAQGFLRALSPKGLALYLGPMRALDTVFPILLALVLSLGIWLYLARRAAIIFGLVAFVAAWLDLQENSAVSDMLNIGADAITTDLVERASTLTMAKWASYLVALCALIFGIIQRRRA